MANTVCGIANATYLPASFNGVPFDAVEVTSEHGRRGAEGEFPFGEITGYADLGRRIRTYTLNGKIQHDGFIGATAALIAACEMPGPGILVHPTRGIVNAACKTIKVSDKIIEEQGVTYVDLEFVEGNIWPNGLSLVGSVVGLSVGVVIESSSASFTVRYQPMQAVPVRRPVVIDTAQEAVGMVADSYALAINTQNDVRKWRGYSDLKEIQQEDVYASNAAMVDQALVLGSNAISLEYTGQTKYQTFRNFANWAAQPVPYSSVAGESVDAIYSHMRIISAAYMAVASVEIQFTKTHEVLAALDTITAILDDEIMAARSRCENALHLELSNFRLNVQTILYDKAYRLPRLIRYDFHGGIHPVVAAYAIYGDAKRHRELEQRNIIDANGRLASHVIAGSAS